MHPDRPTSLNGSNGHTHPISPAAKVADVIRELNSEQHHFAKKVGISQAYLSMLVQGKRRLTDGVITHLAKATPVKESEWKHIRDEFEAWESTHSNRKRSFHPGHTTLTGGVLSNQDIMQAIKEESLLVEPFAHENLSLASLDLTLGESQRLASWKADAGPPDAAEVKERAHIVIRPGETWKMWTRETISLPDNLCGHIAACGDLTTHGIIVGFGVQVDPLWSGSPFFILAHWGSEEYELSHAQPFVSLELRTLCTPCRSEIKGL